MRLSQINIAGFKSFVDPTKIALPAALTGIVGPNGCGKSNVIDAVRWVMGETSAKNLRGESMEDVIFSGSSSRQPVGQATVELVFDNTDGRVTGEYATYNEISIKRVATRAGQSKYFLNNTRCRRRDIADIFLGTGLGPRSYSIIEQGMVTRVIDAKPDELRVYLEEAAGISKYKERRRETENRIRHTRENLDRLIDLIEEIDKQLQRLQRQAKTAERYKTLKLQQRRLEAESLLLQKNSFDHAIEDQQRSLNAAETMMQESVAGLRAAERKIEQTREKLTAANDTHNQIQGRYYQLGADIASQEQAIEHHKNLRQLNRQELANLEQSHSDAAQLLITHDQKLQQLQRQLDEISPALARSNDALAQQNATLEQAEARMHEWQELWDQFRREFHQVHEAAQIENRSIEHIERQVEQTERQQQRLQTEFDNLDATDGAGEINELETNIESCSTAYAALMEQAQARADEILSLRDDCEKSSEKLDKKRNQMQTLRGRLSSLEALQQNLLSETSTELTQWLLRNKIDSSRRLTSLIKVKGNIDKALDVVLAPFLGAYCLSVGDAITDNFMPNQRIAVFDGAAVPQWNDVRRWPRLSDHVDCEIDLSGLLGGIYLCADAAELHQKRAQLKPGESLVTPQGLWAGINWMQQLGDADEHAGLLARGQEIETTQRQLDQIVETTEQLKSRLDQDRQRLQVLDQARDQEQDSMVANQQQLTELRQQLSNRQSAAEQVQVRRQQLQAEITELAALKIAQTTELKSNSARRNEFLAQVQNMSVREVALQQQKQERQQLLTQCRDALQQAREVVHKQQIELRTLESEQRATRSNRERLQHQCDQFGQRTTELSQAIDGVEGPLAESTRSLEELLQLRHQNQQELNRSQQLVGELDTQQRALEGERSNRQQAVDDKRNQLEDERLRLQETQIRCDSILDQLQKTGEDLDLLQQNIDPEADLESWNLQLEKLTTRIERLGPINLAAISEHQEQLERKQYLDAQHQDLISALDTLEAAMRKIDKETKERFKETFEQVNTRMAEGFPRLFGGGEARLEMTENDLLNTGVIIMARPPGKRVTNLQLLSGGEKALTAVALIFAIFALNPSPFCMLDEVDAPLDDANVGRFCTMVAEMAATVQFVMITHNKITMEIAQNLTGVTMHEPGVSRLVSVDVGKAVVLAGAQ